MYSILENFNLLDKNFEKNFELEIKHLFEEKLNQESNLRLKHLTEMEEANLKRIEAKDLIVNRQVNEINKFDKDYEAKLLKYIELSSETYVNLLKDKFNNFFANLDASNLVYNSNNKLVKIIYKRKENSDTNDDSKSVKSDVLSKSSSNYVESPLFYVSKQTYGLFNKVKVHFYHTCVIKDYYLTEIKDLIFNYHNAARETKTKLSNNTNTNTNNTSIKEDLSVSEMFKQSEKFGENIFALVNLFKIKDNKVLHLIESLNNIESQTIKELYYENFITFFERIEKLSKRNLLPNEYDIFTNKFFTLKNIDLIFNVYCKDFSAEQLDLNKRKN